MSLLSSSSSFLFKLFAIQSLSFLPQLSTVKDPAQPHKILLAIRPLSASFMKVRPIINPASLPSQLPHPAFSQLSACCHFL